MAVRDRFHVRFVELGSKKVVLDEVVSATDPTEARSAAITNAFGLGTFWWGDQERNDLGQVMRRISPGNNSSETVRVRVYLERTAEGGTQPEEGGTQPEEEGLVAVQLTRLEHGYLVVALRESADRRCHKNNCGSVCLCAPCSARVVLAALENNDPTLRRTS